MERYKHKNVIIHKKLSKNATWMKKLSEMLLYTVLYVVKDDFK